MSVKKITVNLEDGLTVSIVPLSPRMEARIRKKDPQTFDLIAYRAPFVHLQLVTFTFGQVKIRALCYEYHLPQIVKLLGSETPENALDKCEGFLFEGHVVPLMLGNEKTINILKASIAQRLAPNITALLQSEEQEEA